MLLLFLWLLGASSATQAQLKVVTTISQIGEPLQIIAGEAASVSFLLGTGVDPHLYRPTRSDIAALTGADLIIWTGQTLESKMAPAIQQLARRTPVVALLPLVPEDRLLLDPDKKHDPHLWMDPDLWAIVLRQAVGGLIQLLPDQSQAITQRADAYFQELHELDNQIGAWINSVPQSQRVLVTAHDAFGYFGARYGVDVRGVQGTSTESEAGLRDIERLVALLVDRRIPAVFAETSVSDRNVRALIDGSASKGHQVALGGRLFSDAMGPPNSPEGTYLGMLRHNAATITLALGGDPRTLSAGAD